MTINILGFKPDKHFQRDLVRSLIMGFAVAAGSAAGNWLAKTLAENAKTALAQRNINLPL